MALNKDIKICYVQELESCEDSKTALKERLGIDDTTVNGLFEDFKKKGFLKADDRVKDKKKKFKYFFVGYLFTCYGIVAVYPKYINIKPDKIGEKEEEKLSGLMEVILKVIDKYLDSARAREKGRSKRFLMEDREEESEGNYASHDGSNPSPNEDGIVRITVEMLKDFLENGLYDARKRIREIDGPGETDWNATVNGVTPLLSRGRPVYPYVFTGRRKPDESNYCRRLHRSILCHAYEALRDRHIDAVFHIPPLDMYGDDLGAFGEDDYVRQQIAKELNSQFRSRERQVLEWMDAYVSEAGNLTGGKDGVLDYGVADFMYVWEDVCAKVFNDLLDSDLKAELGKLGIAPAEDFADKKTLRDIIEYPQWLAVDPAYVAVTKAHKGKCYSWIGRHEPDAVTFALRAAADGNAGSESRCFFILDAKYYDERTFRFTENWEDRSGKTLPLNGKPVVSYKGVRETYNLAKQFIYNLIYKPFCDAHGFNETRNCFLMPQDAWDSDEDVKARLAYTVAIGKWAEAANLPDISVYMIPDKKIFELYLRDDRTVLPPDPDASRCAAGTDG